MGDPVSFNRASPQTPVPLEGPKIGAHRETPSSQIASKTLGKTESISGKLLTKAARLTEHPSLKKVTSLLRKALPSSFLEKPEGKPTEKQALAAAKQLLISFKESDYQKEGVFRLSGSGEALKKAKSAISKSKEIPAEVMTPENKAALVKSLLLNVEFFDGGSKQGILDTTIPNIEEFKENPADNFGAEAVAIKSLATAVQKMAPEKREALRELVRVCSAVANESASSKMSVDNLAVVLGPILLPMEPNSIEEARLQVKNQQTLVSFILNLTPDQKQFVFG